MMQLEADRMANLARRPEEFAQEIKVVMEERRLRTDDQPRALLYESLMAAAFQAHPYRRPVIGWMNDLEHMTADDARDWYARWYAPNNAFLVVVGDVSAERGVHARREVLRRDPPRGRCPRASRRTSRRRRACAAWSVKAPAELPYLLMA